MAKVTICIDVSELTRATSFYCDALGCSLAEKHEGYNTLDAEGTKIHLALKAEGSSALGADGPTRSYARHWTPVHLDFDVEDVDAVASEVVRLGGSVEGTKRGSWGAAAFCADPFGNGFCLLAIHPSEA